MFGHIFCSSEILHRSCCILTHRNEQDLTEGPFDPDAAAEEQETMRSSAFDASEKPAVGGKLAPSKIAVIGEGLSAKLKPLPLPLERGVDFNKGSADEETARFVLFSTTWWVVHHSGFFWQPERQSMTVYLAFAAGPPPLCRHTRRVVHTRTVEYLRKSFQMRRVYFAETARVTDRGPRKPYAAGRRQTHQLRSIADRVTRARESNRQQVP